MPSKPVTTVDIQGLNTLREQLLDLVAEADTAIELAKLANLKRLQVRYAASREKSVLALRRYIDSAQRDAHYHCRAPTDQ